MEVTAASTAIHPTAIIDPRAELASGVEVHPYSIIGPHVRIGPGTVVGPHVVIQGRTVIGRRNMIYSGAQVGVVSQDMKHDPNCVGRTIIGDRNIIREHVTISASTMHAPDEEHRVTQIGSDCLFMAYSHVAHDCVVGNHVWMANSAALAGHCTVQDYAILGGLVGVHQDARIGRYAFIGGMTRAVKDCAPFMIVEGNPGRCRGPNAVGLHRHGFSAAAIERIKEMYRLLYRGGLNTSQALARIEEEIADSDERDIILAFYRSTKRGVI